MVITDCKSPAQFVRQMMITVFPYEKLCQQTVSGKGSNRTKNGAPAEGRLDSVKVLAIKKIFLWYLLNLKKMNPIQADMYVERTKKYMAKKISELKRGKNYGEACD